MKEIQMLKRLKENDPEGRKHCIQFLGHFEHRGHLCLMFEPMR
jgi:serine/threonine-protein kinase PRP4